MKYVSVRWYKLTVVPMIVTVRRREHYKTLQEKFCCNYGPYCCITYYILPAVKSLCEPLSLCAFTLGSLTALLMHIIRLSFVAEVVY